MKDKILQQLKTKYSNLGLSVKTLEGFAEQLATTVTEETQIEGAVHGAEFYLKIAQAEADRVRQDAKKNTQPEPQKPEPQKVNEPNNDTPEWAKGFQEKMEALTSKIASLETEKTSTSRRSLLEQKIEKAEPTLKAKILKDFSKMNFGSDDEFNEYLTDTENDVSVIVQNTINTTLSSKPIIGGGMRKTEPTEQELDAVMQNI